MPHGAGHGNKLTAVLVDGTTVNNVTEHNPAERFTNEGERGNTNVIQQGDALFQVQSSYGSLAHDDLHDDRSHRFWW